MLYEVLTIFDEDLDAIVADEIIKIFERITKIKAADVNIKFLGKLNDRITSYNVCYTKLLRFSMNFPIETGL